MTPEEIKSKLEHYGITRYQLAKEYDLNEGNLSHILSGKQGLSKFARAFFELLFEKLEKSKI